MDTEGGIESVFINRVSILSRLKRDNARGLSFPRVAWISSDYFESFSGSKQTVCFNELSSLSRCTKNGVWLHVYKGIALRRKIVLTCKFHSCTIAIYLDSYTMQFGNNHPKMCMRRNACAQFGHTMSVSECTCISDSSDLYVWGRLLYTYFVVSLSRL